MTLQGINQSALQVLAISGSLRKASFNSGLLRAAREISPDGMEITIFGIRDLPFYDGDVEGQGDPASVVALKSAVRGADAADHHADEGDQQGVGQLGAHMIDVVAA